MVQVTDKRGKNHKPTLAHNPVGKQEAPPWFPVFVQFETERLRQIEKWGDQRGKRQDGTGSPFYVDWAVEYQRQNDEREAAGKPGVWAKILLGEVFEALSEDDPISLEHELVQAGAVITAWIEDLHVRRS